jgi:hypothetical protein
LRHTRVGLRRRRRISSGSSTSSSRISRSRSSSLTVSAGHRQVPAPPRSPQRQAALPDLRRTRRDAGAALQTRGEAVASRAPAATSARAAASRSADTCARAAATSWTRRRTRRRSSGCARCSSSRSVLLLSLLSSHSLPHPRSPLLLLPFPTPALLPVSLGCPWRIALPRPGR